jgi:hypothetical protein
VFATEIFDGETGIPAAFKKRYGFVAGVKAFVQFGLHQHHFFSAFHREQGDHAEGGGSLEIADLFFPFHDEPYGDGLHAARGQCRLYLLPQQRREFEAHQPVEHAAGLLGHHQVLVDGPRIFDRLQDGVFGDLVKDDAVRVLLCQFQYLCQVGGNGFPFAVLIGCQPYLFSILCHFFQLGDHLLLLGRDDVFR